MSFLRPARDAKDALARAELIQRAARQLVEIEQYYADIAAWNAAHPECEPIDPDPDGAMVGLVEYFQQFQSR